MPQAAPAIAGWAASAAAGSAVASFGAAVAVGVGTAIVYGAVYVAVTVAIGYGLSALATSLYAGKLGAGGLNAANPLQMSRNATPSRRVIYGRTRVSGPMLFAHVSGLNNKYLYLVVALAGHPCAAMEDIYFNDELVTFDGSGNATGKFAGVAKVVKHLGATDQASDAMLVAACPGIWTADHRLRGVTYLAVQLTYDTAKLPGGIPNITGVAKGRIVYDPRTETSIWSANVALCILDYLISPFGLKADLATEIDLPSFVAAANVCDEPVALATSFNRNCAVTAGDTNIGMSTQAAAQLDGITEGMPVAGTGIPVGARVTYINRAGPDYYFAIDVAPSASGDPVSVLFGSSEPRYEANGSFELVATPRTILESLVGAMAGTLVYTGGKWVCHAGAHRTPTITLDEDDLRGGLRIQPKLSMREMCNRVKGTYASPANKWQPTDFVPIVNATYLAEDDGVEYWHDLELNFTTSHSMAQRLAKITLEIARQEIVVKAPCKLTALGVRGGDVIMFSNTRQGWAAKQFMVPSLQIPLGAGPSGVPSFGLDLTLRETAAGVWDWNAGEETVVDLAPNTNLPDPRVVVNPTGLTLTSGATTGFVQPDGTVIPRLKVAWTAPADQPVLSGGAIRIEYKTTVAPEWSEWARVKGDQTFDFVTDVQIGISYLVRVRSENNLGVPAATWVESGAHTVLGDTVAPNAPTGLTAAVGTGKAVVLNWNPVSNDDLSEYYVYRSTLGSGSGFTKVGQVTGTRWPDIEVFTGVPYWYYVVAVDGSENESGASNVVSATPTDVGSGDVDDTAPATPAAPTYNSESTYSAGTGAVFAQVTINMPALPSGAKGMYARYRVQTSGSWVLGDYQTSGGGTARLDDLSPGVTYEFSVLALSFANTPSASSGLLTRTAPNKTTGPATPTAAALSADGVIARISAVTLTPAFGCRLKFDHVADKDLAYYEIKATATNSDAAVDYTWTDVASDRPIRTLEKNVQLYDFGVTPGAGHVRVRAVNTSGVASAWAYAGNAASNWSIGVGQMALQNRDDVTSTGLTLGQSGAIKKAVDYGRMGFVTFAGGSPTESHDFAITGFGTVAPDWGTVNISSDPDSFGRYDWDASTSSNARLIFRRFDGGNLTPGLRRIQFFGGRV